MPNDKDKQTEKLKATAKAYVHATLRRRPGYASGVLREFDANNSDWMRMLRSSLGRESTAEERRALKGEVIDLVTRLTEAEYEILGMD